MLIQRLLVRTFVTVWFVCSVALFYWVGLVLEAFQLTVDETSLCRLICVVWSVSAIVSWMSYRRHSLLEHPASSAMYVRILRYAYLVAFVVLDVWLVVQGIRVGSGWLLIPVTHLVVSYLMNFRTPSN